MARFSPIRIDRLPFPDVISRVDFEAILSEFKAKLPEFISDEQTRADVIAVLSAPIEGDLIEALLQTFAYFYMTKLAEENDKAKAVMLPYAYGSTLDVLAYNLYGTSRLEGESDAALRERAMLSWEALSTAGPYGAYTFHAKSAHPRVKDVAVLGPESGLVQPGEVKVVILSDAANGVPAPSVIDAVSAYLNDGERRPLTDKVIVAPAEILSYTIEATLEIGAGRDFTSIKSAASAKLAAYIKERHIIGGTVPLSGVMAALHVEGVERVVLARPLADVIAAVDQAPFCSGFSIFTERVA